MFKSMKSYALSAKNAALSVVAATALVFAVAAPVSAQQVGGYAGGGIVIVGGTTSNNTNYASHVDGTSGSDVGGGSMATGSVYGTGASQQATQNGASSWSSSAGQLGQGYAGTKSDGASSTYNNTAGATYGSGTGHSEGQAGADYSAAGHASYSVDYTGNAQNGSVYLGGIIAGAVGVAYQPYASYGK